MMKNVFTEKQVHILQVAEELIAQNGFEGTSVRDISSKANVNVAMISYYFGSKKNMMYYLYRYRLLKIKEHFGEFFEIIKEANPEMQMKEIIKYLTSQVYKYSFFYGFVSHEMRTTTELKTDLLAFHEVCVQKIDEIIKKGVVIGVFTFAAKPEDILSTILGVNLFAIRNKDFFSQFVPYEDEKNYLEKAQEKTTSHLLTSIFANLGYTPQEKALNSIK